MWYKKAQLGPLLPSLSIDPFLLSTKKPIDNNTIEKIKDIIEKLPEDKKIYYYNKFNQLNQPNQINDNSQNKIETWNQFSNELKKEINQQNINSMIYMQSIVNQRSVGRSDSFDDFVDADKIFKQYLDARGNLQFFDNLSNSNDIFEIAKFFIDNATDPKFDVVKKIIKRFPNNVFKYVDVVDLLLNFYLASKLNELKAVLMNRNPQTDNDKLAIMFIDSKLVIHNAKIGSSLFNIVNKNIFGKLLSSLTSVALESTQSLQDMMGVDKSIQKSINQSGK